MTGLAENSSERLVAKYYASGALVSNQQADPATAPGASGGQAKRFVTFNPAMSKADIANNEKRTDRQQPLGKQGTQRWEGSLEGLLSPSTYETEFEAAMRGTWASVSSLTASDLTSVSADNSSSKFAFGGGNPVTSGMRIGQIMRFTGLSDDENNSRNFLILGFGGSNNREVTVYPAPDTMSADTDFTVSFPGGRLVIPSSDHVSRLSAWEKYYPDAGFAALYTEARCGGFNIGVNADTNVTVSFPFMGRGRFWYKDSDAPFFTSPTAQTDNEVCGPVSGLLRVNGENLGLVTALSFGINLNPQAPSVVLQKFSPEIFLGPAVGTGNISFFVDRDAVDLVETFDDETRVEILPMFQNSDDADAETLAFYMPYCQLGNLSDQDDGSGGKVFSGPFAFGPRAGTAAAGQDTSMIQIVDTTVTP